MLKQNLVGLPKRDSEALSIVLKEHLRKVGKSIYQLSNDSGVDSAYIWRVLNSERREVSREIVVLICLALVLGEDQVDEVVEVANVLLEAAGYRQLRINR